MDRYRAGRCVERCRGVIGRRRLVGPYVGDLAALVPARQEHHAECRVGDRTVQQVAIDVYDDLGVRRAVAPIGNRAVAPDAAQGAYLNVTTAVARVDARKVDGVVPDGGTLHGVAATG